MHLFGVGQDLSRPPSAVAAPGSALPMTTPRGTHMLVTLRDGNSLHTYGVEDGSTVYAGVETERDAEATEKKKEGKKKDGKGKKKK